MRISRLFSILLVGFFGYVVYLVFSTIPHNYKKNGIEKTLENPFNGLMGVKIVNDVNLSLPYLNLICNNVAIENIKDIKLEKHVYQKGEINLVSEKMEISKDLSVFKLKNSVLEYTLKDAKHIIHLINLVNNSLSDLNLTVKIDNLIIKSRHNSGSENILIKNGSIFIVKESFEVNLDVVINDKEFSIGVIGTQQNDDTKMYVINIISDSFGAIKFDASQKNGVFELKCDGNIYDMNDILRIIVGDNLLSIINPKINTSKNIQINGELKINDRGVSDLYVLFADDKNFITKVNISNPRDVLYNINIDGLQMDFKILNKQYIELPEYSILSMLNHDNSIGSNFKINLKNATINSLDMKNLTFWFILDPTQNSLRIMELNLLLNNQQIYSDKNEYKLDKFSIPIHIKDGNFLSFSNYMNIFSDEIKNKKSNVIINRKNDEFSIDTLLYEVDLTNELFRDTFGIKRKGELTRIVKIRRANLDKSQYIKNALNDIYKKTHSMLFSNEQLSLFFLTKDLHDNIKMSLDLSDCYFENLLIDKMILNLEATNKKIDLQQFLLKIRNQILDVSFVINNDFIAPKLETKISAKNFNLNLFGQFLNAFAKYNHHTLTTNSSLMIPSLLGIGGVIDLDLGNLKIDETSFDFKSILQLKDGICESNDSLFVIQDNITLKFNNIIDMRGTPKISAAFSGMINTDYFFDKCKPIEMKNTSLITQGKFYTFGFNLDELKKNIESSGSINARYFQTTIPDFDGIAKQLRNGNVNFKTNEMLQNKNDYIFKLDSDFRSKNGVINFKLALQDALIPVGLDIVYDMMENKVNFDGILYTAAPKLDNLSQTLRIKNKFSGSIDFTSCNLDSKLDLNELNQYLIDANQLIKKNQF